MNWEHLQGLCLAPLAAAVQPVAQGRQPQRGADHDCGRSAPLSWRSRFHRQLHARALRHSQGRACAPLFAWDALVFAFLFFWLIGLITELQRSDSLALSKFLHLPVSASGAFLINYFGSLLRLSLIVFVPGHDRVCPGAGGLKGSRCCRSSCCLRRSC